jgi:hypothetical protein
MPKVVHMRTLVSTSSQHRKANRIQKIFLRISLGQAEVSASFIHRKHATVEPRYNNEHRAFNSYSYNEVIAISNQGLSDHVPHHL